MTIYEKIILGDLEGVKILVEEEGVEVNNIDLDNCTPLHFAVASESIEIVNYLLANGADPNVRNDLGNTPFEDAITSDNQELIECFSSVENNFKFAK